MDDPTTGKQNTSAHCCWRGHEK